MGDGRWRVLYLAGASDHDAAEKRPPTDWRVPNPKGFYSRGSIVELLPDPLSPLFASLAPEPVARTFRKIFDELLGESVMTEKDMQFVTINGYAYYGMVLTPRLSWPVVRMAPGATWRMIGRESGERLWRETYSPRYAGTVERWEAKPVRDLPAAELLSGVENLLYAGAEYYTSVQAIDTLRLHERGAVQLVLRAPDQTPRRPTAGNLPARCFDNAPIRAEKSLYDLATWTRGHLAAALLNTPSDGYTTSWIQTCRQTGLTRPSGASGAAPPESPGAPRAHGLRPGLCQVVPADDPAPTFDTLKYYLRGEGKDPSERQRALAARRRGGDAAIRARLMLCGRSSSAGFYS